MFPDIIAPTLVWIVTIFLFVVGLAGTLIPALPGIVIIFFACVWQGLWGTVILPWWVWAILAGLTTIGLIIDKITGAKFAQYCGASKQSAWWAMLAFCVGVVFFSFLWAILIPAVVILFYEFAIRGTILRSALQASAGGVFGLLLGIFVEFCWALLIIGVFLFCYWSV